jgi:hypothetical protein
LPQPGRHDEDSISGPHGPPRLEADAAGGAIDHPPFAKPGFRVIAKVDGHGIAHAAGMPAAFRAATARLTAGIRRNADAPPDIRAPSAIADDGPSRPQNDRKDQHQQAGQGDGAGHAGGQVAQFTHGDRLSTLSLFASASVPGSPVPRS